MKVFHYIHDYQNWRAEAAGKVVVVPTMGALHEGHLHLMKQARELAGVDGRVVVSIFVNPTQFGPNEDFDRYPRELELDAKKCESVGVDAIFAPAVSEMYEDDRSISLKENVLSQLLCGASRPGHFDGVCLVVLKLFMILGPQIAVFGKKDYQQLAIIRRMVRDLNVLIQIVGVETVRESDGLAMSSRNRYLSPEERAQAPEIRKALLQLKAKWEQGLRDAAQLEQGVREALAQQAPLHRVDYIRCVDQENLGDLREGKSALVAVAIYFGKTRLIDNLELENKN